MKTKHRPVTISICSLLLVITLLSGSPLIGAEKKITNSFVETDLRQALQDIAIQAGVTIVAGLEVEGFVTCELSEVTLERALKIVLGGTGYEAVQMADFYLVTSTDPKSPSFPLISSTSLLKLNYVKAETACNQLTPRFQAYVKADPEKNTVLITAPQSLMDRIVADLKVTDQPPRHVMLEARVVALERDNVLNTGVRWNWPQVSAGIMTDSIETPDTPWGIQMGYTPDRTYTNSLLLTLNLLTANDEAMIFATPKVMGQDGKEAEIQVLNEEYFEILTQGYYTSSELEKISSGTLLKIVPHIGDDDLITLDMSVEVSDVISRREDDLPVVTRRTARSTFRLKDGGTAVVAGLLDNRQREADADVPGFREIPLVGYLFRDKAREHSYRQVAVFVTAHLVCDTRAKDEPEPSPVKVEPVGDEFKVELIKSVQKFKKHDIKR